MSTDEPSVGSAADEATRLADALGRWFRCTTTGTDSSSEDLPVPPHDPLTCLACPLCRGIAAVRSVRPEVVEHLACAAESLAAALRELGALPTPGTQGPESSGKSGPAHRERHESVHIDIDDDDEGAA